MTSDQRQARPRVVIADDYAALVAAVTQLLAPSCDVVGDVADGAELLEAVTRLRPDVVVADIHLPGLNGLEACRRIAESGLNAKVIVISTATDPDIQRSALAAGASAFVSKFAIADDLEAAVARAFEETRAQSS